MRQRYTEDEKNQLKEGPPRMVNFGASLYVMDEEREDAKTGETHIVTKQAVIPTQMHYIGEEDYDEAAEAD